MTAIGDTLLVLSGIGVPEFSTRAATQTLVPIEASAQLRRTINGELLDVSFDQFQKFKSSITCTDFNPPACDGVWPGRVVLVECVSELCYVTGGVPSRAPVSGSEREVGAFTFYRPVLSMMVAAPIQVQTDEWNAVVQWQMDLEEI